MSVTDMYFVTCLGIGMEVLNFQWFKNVTLFPRKCLLPWKIHSIIWLFRR